MAKKQVSRASRRREWFEKSLAEMGVAALRFDEAEAEALWRRWLETFAEPVKRATGTWIDGEFPWHAFSRKFVHALAVGEAEEAYRAAWAVAPPEGLELVLLPDLVLPPKADRSLAYLCTAPEPLLPPCQECMAFPPDYSWTMAFTHEDGWIGPFFCRRQWVKNPTALEP